MTQVTKTNLFNLQWCWYEDKNDYLFIHDNKTKEQFKQDVNEMLIKYGKEYLDQEESWAGANKWIDYISKKLPELGYQTVEPITSSFFGAYIITERHSSDDKEWGEIVGEELLQHAIEHNETFEKEMEVRNALYNKKK